MGLRVSVPLHVWHMQQMCVCPVACVACVLESYATHSSQMAEIYQPPRLHPSLTLTLTLTLTPT